MSFWSYDGWKTHDPAWDAQEEQALGPYCADCGESMPGADPITPGLCHHCQAWRIKARQQRAQMRLEKGGKL